MTNCASTHIFMSRRTAAMVTHVVIGDPYLIVTWNVTVAAPPTARS